MKFFTTIAALCFFLITFAVILYIGFTAPAFRFPLFIIASGLCCVSLCAVIPLPSDGVFKNHQLGIRLGGGAGIGACFMVLAWWFACYPPEPSTKPSKYCVIDKSEFELEAKSIQSIVMHEDSIGCIINELQARNDNDEFQGMGKYVIMFDKNTQQKGKAKIKVLVSNNGIGTWHIFSIPVLKQSKSQMLYELLKTEPFEPTATSLAK